MRARLFSLLSLYLGSVGCSQRQKRHVLDLCGMMVCAVGSSCVAYNEYGCFCGRGGYGRPVDAIDACCLDHDLCYANLPDTCWPKWSPFQWSCHYGRPSCDPLNQGCRKGACDCDAAFANCLARHPYPARRKACPVPLKPILPSSPAPTTIAATTTTPTPTTTTSLRTTSPRPRARQPPRIPLPLRPLSDAVEEGGGQEEASGSNDGGPGRPDGKESSVCARCNGGPWRNSFSCYVELLSCSFTSTFG